VLNELGEKPSIWDISEAFFTELLRTASLESWGCGGRKFGCVCSARTAVVK
jgi:hypothetical protein